MFTWKRFGGYEVSTKGDRRFSAFNAILPDGRSIEQVYQCDIKGYQPGGTNWRLGKGKPPLNNISSKELWKKYLELWELWAEAHLQLMLELKRHAEAHESVLSDRFASTPINQAHALACILNNMSCPVLEVF